MQKTPPKDEYTVIDFDRMEEAGGYDCPWRAEGLWGRQPQDHTILTQCITVKDSQAISQGHSYTESLPFDRRLPTGYLRITPLHCRHAPTTPLNPIGALNSLSSYGRAPRRCSDDAQLE